MRYLLGIIALFFFSCDNQHDGNIEDLAPPSSSGAQPYLFSNNNALYMSWQEVTDSANSLKYSMYSNEEWAAPRTLASGKNWFINWADFPGITVNKAGNIISHYLPKSGNSSYAYDINLVVSRPDTTWKLHDDTVKGEHGFVSAIPYEDDSFIIAWLDGRNATTDGHNHGGAMNLRAAIVGPSGQKEQEWLLDEKVCDCCQTSMAMTDKGPVVVYRDRSGEEIRDISIRRFNGRFWTASERVAKDNWKINGCPVNGPKVVASDNKVVVAWYTGAGNQPTVKYAVSETSGISFSQPVVVSTSTIGRVDLAFDEDNNIWLSHISTEDKKVVLKALKYNFQGELLEELKVAEMDPGRSTGFPQMEIFDEKLYFAWTKNAGTTGIELKYINL